MQNQLLCIEKAKVINVGQYLTGTSDNGAWASIQIKVEWEYMYSQEEEKPRKMSAYILFKGQNAAWVRDNVRPGNPLAQPVVPEMYVNLWIRTYAERREYTKKDGTKGEDKSTLFIGEFIQPYEQK